VSPKLTGELKALSSAGKSSASSDTVCAIPHHCESRMSEFCNYAVP